MKKKLIGVYGETQLSDHQVEFVKHLAIAILNHPETVLVTGGFDYFKANPEGRSTDRSAANAALELLGAETVNQRLETWLPETGRDRPDVQRFPPDLGRTKILKGKSALARRFFLTNGVDALITFAGDGNTTTVLELAATIGKAAFPLPFTGDDSGAFWKDNRAEIVKRFALTEAFASRLEGTKLEELSEDQKQHLAVDIVNVVRLGIRRRCLVLMHFDKDPNDFYDHWLEPAIQNAGFESIRIDREVIPGHIRGIFQKQLVDCEKVVADITEVNPNVMYEIGQAHSSGIEPFLFSRRRLHMDEIPFYLHEYKIESPETAGAESRSELLHRIKTYLTAVEVEPQEAQEAHREISGSGT